MKTRSFLTAVAALILMVVIPTCAKAQDPFKNLTENGDVGTVKTPNIENFVTTYLSDPQDEHQGFLHGMWKKYRRNEPFENGEKVTVDAKNGYVCFETAEDEIGYSSATEMCYWNCDDKKHKLFAENVIVTLNGKPAFTEFSGLYVYVYDNTTQKLYMIDQELLGLGDEVRGEITFRLPQKGKDIDVFFSDGTQKKLAWNGKGFTLK